MSIRDEGDPIHVGVEYMSIGANPADQIAVFIEECVKHTLAS